MRDNNIDNGVDRTREVLKGWIHYNVLKQGENPCPGDWYLSNLFKLHALEKGYLVRKVVKDRVVMSVTDKGANFLYGKRNEKHLRDFLRFDIYGIGVPPDFFDEATIEDVLVTGIREGYVSQSFVDGTPRCFLTEKGKRFALSPVEDFLLNFDI